MSSRADDRNPRGVSICFALASLSAVGFAVSYGLDLGTPALGATLGAALAFVALGLALWARAIGSREPDYVEERGLEPASTAEVKALQAALSSEPIPRARVLWSMLGVALGSIGVAALFPLRSMFPSQGGNPDELLSHTAWRPGRRLVTEEGKLLRPSDIEMKSIHTVFPEGYNTRQAPAAAVLLRVDPALLVLPPGRRAWVVDGIVAYSKLCTHAGCPVGLYADDYEQLLCPCHHSVFNVLQAARPVEGPAPHPLPQLPLAVDGAGYLVARGDFSGPVGAAWWGYRS